MFPFVLNWAKISFYFLNKMHLKQNQIILNNMTLTKFKKSVKRHKNIYLKSQKQRPDEIKDMAGRNNGKL